MKNKKYGFSLLIFPLIFILLSIACSLPFSNTFQEDSPQANTIYMAEILIWVEVPDQTPADEIIQLVIVDEVTGLDRNFQIHDMIKVDATHHGVVLQKEIGSILKYRYIRSGQNPLTEQTIDGNDVRYRMYYADGPGEVHDIVSKWEDTDPIRSTGRIIGKITEIESEIPIENLMILVGGQQAFTLADGSFTVNNLPTGQHQLLVYALDGSYQSSKQNVVVADGAATPVQLQLARSRWIEVAFTVTVPEDTVPTVPLRLAGNLFQLGNRFSDLGGGTSGLAENMPTLTEIGANQYRVILTLPVGADIRYKFTQGDGFWNSEIQKDGDIQLRQLIIPWDSSNLNINDNVISWNSGHSEGIWFDLHVPDNTLPTDNLYIQFKQGSWMAPIPMWSIEENRWAFKLLGPTDIGELNYRYCLNAQCGDQNSGDSGVMLEIRKTNTDFSDSPIHKDLITEWN